MRNLTHILYKRKKKAILAGKSARQSYAQCGEDLIMDFLLQANGIEFPSYLDLGAHHPSYLSNTYTFYQRGCRGVNVEANPQLMPPFLKTRNRDINLNVGITDTRSADGLDFYIMTAPTMSTFSKAEAERVQAESSIRISEVARIPTLTLQDLIDTHCQGRFPDILTCDIEGLDDLVIDSLHSFTANVLPKVICLETATFQEVGFGRKKTALIDKTRALGYEIFADTFINTIFRHADALK